MKIIHIYLIVIVVFSVLVSSNSNAADNLPSSIDPGRVGAEKFSPKTLSLPKKAIKPEEVTLPKVNVPKEAKKIEFFLKKIVVEGSTIFKPEDIKKLYNPYLDTKISLETAWQIADAITKFYQDSGYFLSRAFLPEQEIGADGSFKIRVVEGYVGSVEIEGNADNYVINRLIKKIQLEKPVNIKSLESLALNLNDLPGGSFRTVIENMNSKGREEEGAVKLRVIKEVKKGRGQVSFDNYNSMFLGPQQVSMYYETSFFPLNKSSISFLNSPPHNKLRSYNLNHNVVILPGIVFEVSGGYTNSHPGYTLKSNNIISDSDNLGIGINAQIIRQRQENLSVKLKLEGREVATEVLTVPITRESIRTIRASVSYDHSDSFAGYNFINVTASKGISALGASKAGDGNLSRTGAQPQYKKLEINLNRFQELGKSCMLVNAFSTQMSSGVLYSSEQYGYGGQSFGRAYDPSEITGDKGISASLELRYTAIPSWQKVSFVPYAFYDVGKVWSVNDVAAAGASGGFGIRLDSEKGTSGNFLIAAPLTRDISTPPYGNGKSPRFLFQLTHSF